MPSLCRAGVNSRSQSEQVVSKRKIISDGRNPGVGNYKKEEKSSIDRSGISVEIFLLASSGISFSMWKVWKYQGTQTRGSTMRLSKTSKITWD